ncbi:MAG TPA: glycosyltransferase family 2 protein [Bacteroidales bacterium]|jgi:glycosyltransferase involved in cell wall biosynthesis|nr:glycosyltransferase family 2 protein [Bacteroidales bacterium]HQJ21090.1 glycosyltransferase family 2 protein [Bacteroidales bacterium]
MDRNIKLSFIIPTYNAEQHISECIHSLYCQDIPIEDYEVIVVNDCSTDNSKSILIALQNEFPTIKIIDHQTNKKQGGARNTGVKNAMGEYIWFIDSDDYIKPNVLRELLNIVDDYNLDILHFDFTRVFIDGSTEEYPLNSASQVMDGNTFFFDKNEVWWKRNVEVWRRIHKKSFLIENELSFEENVPVYEDVSYSMLAFNKAKRVMHISKSPYYYRFNTDSYLNSNPTANKISDLIKSSLSCLAFCNKLKLPREFILALIEFTQFQIYYAINLSQLLTKSEQIVVSNYLNELYQLNQEELFEFKQNDLLNNTNNLEKLYTINTELAMRLFKEFNIINKNKRVIKNCSIITLQSNIDCLISIHYNKWKIFIKIINLFLKSKSVRQLVNNLFSLFKLL